MILILFFAHKASSSHTTDLSHTLDDTHSPGWHISAFAIPSRQVPRNTLRPNQEPGIPHSEARFTTFRNPHSHISEPAGSDIIVQQKCRKKPSAFVDTSLNRDTQRGLSTPRAVLENRRSQPAPTMNRHLLPHRTSVFPKSHPDTRPVEPQNDT